MQAARFGAERVAVVGAGTVNQPGWKKEVPRRMLGSVAHDARLVARSRLRTSHAHRAGRYSASLRHKRTVQEDEERL